MKEVPQLSIVIPAWKESERLPGSLAKVCDYLMRESLSGEKSEIVIVLEACEDRSLTIEGIEHCRENFPDISIVTLENDVRYGKGYTVRKGVMASAGRFILMTDADMSVPIDELTAMWNFMKAEKFDCVIGKRIQVLPQPWYRKAMGRGFSWLTAAIVGLPFSDTQCGFKLFTAEFAKTIFEDVSILGFGFDIEVIALGLQRGYRIGEFKVKWYDDVRSTVNPVEDSIKMFRNLFEVRRKIRSNHGE